MKVTNTTAEIESNPMRGLAMMLPGGIEASERRGQAELVESDVLPIDMSPSREAFEALGFRFGAPVDGDPLFIAAELPAGWSKVPTDHDMWSRVLDEKGRARVRVFYKAAFYDRRAHMGLERRYDVTGIYPNGPRGERAGVAVVDGATGETIWSGGLDAYGDAYAWLKENRPDGDDPIKAREGA